MLGASSWRRVKSLGTIWNIHALFEIVVVRNRMIRLWRETIVSPELIFSVWLFEFDLIPILINFLSAYSERIQFWSRIKPTFPGENFPLVVRDSFWSELNGSSLRQFLFFGTEAFNVTVFIWFDTDLDQFTINLFRKNPWNFSSQTYGGSRVSKFFLGNFFHFESLESRPV